MLWSNQLYLQPGVAALLAAVPGSSSRSRCGGCGGAPLLLFLRRHRSRNSARIVLLTPPPDCIAPLQPRVASLCGAPVGRLFAGSGGASVASPPRASSLLSRHVMKF